MGPTCRGTRIEQSGVKWYLREHRHPVGKGFHIGAVFDTPHQRKWQEHMRVTVFNGDFVDVILKLAFEEVVTVLIANS